MKCKVTTIGCEQEYGVEKVIVEDDEIGEITIHEIELDSLGPVADLVRDSNVTVEFTESVWDKYDADMTIICGK